MNAITRRKLFERLSYLPLLNCYIGRSLFAQGSGKTKRLVKFVTPLGVNPETWPLKAGALTAQALSSHTHLSPLEPFANSLGVIHGLTGDRVPLAHWGAGIPLFTGLDWTGDDKGLYRAKGPSMDMIIADKLYDPAKNLFRALHAGVAIEERKRNQEQGHVSFANTGAFVDMIHSPKGLL